MESNCFIKIQNTFALSNLIFYFFIISKILFRSQFSFQNSWIINSSNPLFYLITFLWIPKQLSKFKLTLKEKLTLFTIHLYFFIEKLCLFFWKLYNQNFSLSKINKYTADKFIWFKEGDFLWIIECLISEINAHIVLLSCSFFSIFWKEINDFSF